VPQPRATLDPDRGPRSHRRLQEKVQPSPPAQQTGLPKSGALRGEFTSIPGSGQGWTTSVSRINFNQPSRPTLRVARKGESDHPKKARARPSLVNPHTLPAIFEDNQFGTSNIGPVAFSAKWSAYGEYLHKMMEAIQIQWDRILIESRTEPPSNTVVTVKFTLDFHGKVTSIVDIKNTSDEQGKQSCHDGALW